MPTQPLTLSIDAIWDWLSCFELGFIDDGIPTHCWVPLVDEEVALAMHPQRFEPAGFTVLGWQEFDASEHEVLFAEPHFTVPQLGLRDASIGAICLAARAWLGQEPTIGRAYFQQAVNAPTREKATEAWSLCLEAGDLQAHYGLGYTWFELGDLDRAYSHLRAYTELAPWNAWGWCWFGKVCAARGELEDARQAFSTALELEGAGHQETDAAELLAEL